MEIKYATNSFTLLPPAPGKCKVCAEDEHDDNIPHNRDSFFYQTQFQMNFGRCPTWADAASTCPPEVQAELKAFLVENGISQKDIGDL